VDFVILLYYKIVLSVALVHVHEHFFWVVSLTFCLTLQLEILALADGIVFTSQYGDGVGVGNNTEENSVIDVAFVGDFLWLWSVF